jgi:hypothetical protein
VCAAIKHSTPVLPVEVAQATYSMSVEGGTRTRRAIPSPGARCERRGMSTPSLPGYEVGDTTPRELTRDVGETAAWGTMHILLPRTAQPERGHVALPEPATGRYIVIT